MFDSEELALTWLARAPRASGAFVRGPEAGVEIGELSGAKAASVGRAGQ